MTLGFTDGAYNRASGTRDAFAALSDALVAEGLPPMVSGSGDRERADQERIWRERMTLTPGGRKTYGYRWWQGKKWWQIHPDTVAPPGTGNHEARRSNDLKWPYNSDTAAARRAKELAKRHNITREGENFRELWHWTFWGPLGTIGTPAPAGGATTLPQEEDEMLVLKIDAGARGTHIATLDNKTFSHVIKEDDPDWVKNVVRSDDRYTDVPLAKLPVLLRRYGCDLHIWDIRNGQFVVLDPLTGVASPGAVWTAENAIRSSVEQVKVTSAETRAYVEHLAKSVNGTAA